MEFEQWQIRGAEDFLCVQYDGTIWPLGEGPQPEQATHPNCRCERVHYEYQEPTDITESALARYELFQQVKDQDSNIQESRFTALDTERTEKKKSTSQRLKGFFKKALRLGF